MTKSQEKQ